MHDVQEVVTRLEDTTAELKEVEREIVELHNAIVQTYRDEARLLGERSGIWGDIADIEHRIKEEGDA